MRRLWPPQMPAHQGFGIAISRRSIDIANARRRRSRQNGRDFALIGARRDWTEFFSPARQKIVGLRGLWRKRGLSALDGYLAFALQRPEVDAVIVGVNCLSEFEQIEPAAASSAGVDSDIDIDQPIDPVYVDPSRWPAFVH
jgi:aryl-alcohol dehydrogenase-like predicted oxidoreductase